MRQVNNSLSPFNDSSLVAAINRGEDPEADYLLQKVFTVSKQVNQWSGGYFDPTVAPLINLYGFGPAGPSNLSPTLSSLDSARSLVGLQDCSISNGHIVKKHPSTQFNFSAIAKGYGCDLVADMLRRNGCVDYMVEIGGEIAMSGVNPRGEDWHIQIDTPQENNESVTHDRLEVITPGKAYKDGRCGVATSGNYRNYHVTSDGKKAVHTINPLTGAPAISSTLSVTVIAPSCILADALATACMAMPLDSAKAMIKRIPQTRAIFAIGG